MKLGNFSFVLIQATGKFRTTNRPIYKEVTLMDNNPSQRLAK